MHKKVPVAISTLAKETSNDQNEAKNKAGKGFLELKRNSTKPNRTEKHLQKHWKRKA